MIKRGMRVKLTEAGLKFFTRTAYNRPSVIKWERRQGVLETVSPNKNMCQVRWDGNKASSDRIPAKFVESV